MRAGKALAGNDPGCNFYLENPVVIILAAEGEQLPRPKTPEERQERAELREEALQEKIWAKYPDPVIE